MNTLVGANSGAAFPTIDRRVRRYAIAVELASVLVLACGAGLAGTAIVERFRSGGGQQQFYQIEFGPAVMLACGHGYREPLLHQLPDLRAFLETKVDRFDCAALPATVPSSPALNSFHRTSRYLESTVALFWTLAGISWSRLAVIGGLLLASVVCLVYGLARVGLSRGWALFVVALTASSPLNLQLVPHYRDYAKAPFILAMILLMSWLAIGARRRATVLILAACGGVVGGLGLGFRNDLLLVLLPFVLTLLVFTPPNLPRLWMTRALAVAMFVMTFLAVARPVLADYSQGSNTGHVILLGLSKPYDESLAIQGAVYDYGYDYSDDLAAATIDSFARRSGRWPGGVVLGTSDYDWAAMNYLRELAVRFPADLVTRTLAAIRGVLVLTLVNHQTTPSWMKSSGFDWAFQLRALVASWLAPLTVLAAFLLIVGTAGRSVRLALFLTAILIVFAGGAALQFGARHYFHLEFVPWLAVALALQTLVRMARGLKRSGGFFYRAHVAWFAVVIVSVLGASVLLSRLYQDRQVRALVDSYLAAAATPVPVLFEPFADGMVRAGWNAEAIGAAPRPPQTSFAVAEFTRNECPADVVRVKIRYAPAPVGDFSHDVDVATGGSGAEPARVLFPVYELQQAARFQGIELQESMAPCLASIRKIMNPTEPILLEASLGPDWRRGKLHQTLTFWTKP